MARYEIHTASNADDLIGGDYIIHDPDGNLFGRSRLEAYRFNSYGLVLHFAHFAIQLSGPDGAGWQSVNLTCPPACECHPYMA